MACNAHNRSVKGVDYYGINIERNYNIRRFKNTGAVLHQQVHIVWEGGKGYCSQKLIFEDSKGRTETLWHNYSDDWRKYPWV